MAEGQAENWHKRGLELAKAHKKHQWECDDWILEGAELFGENVYGEAQKIFVGYTRSTLYQWAYIARAFPTSIRIESDHLTFGHYQCVLSASWGAGTPRGPSDFNDPKVPPFAVPVLDVSPQLIFRFQRG
jgi:hypothetical protein